MVSSKWGCSSHFSEQLPKPPLCNHLFMLYSFNLVFFSVLSIVPPKIDHSPTLKSNLLCVFIESAPKTPHSSLRTCSPMMSPTIDTFHPEHLNMVQSKLIHHPVWNFKFAHVCGDPMQFQSCAESQSLTIFIAQCPTNTLRIKCVQPCQSLVMLSILEGGTHYKKGCRPISISKLVSLPAQKTNKTTMLCELLYEMSLKWIIREDVFWMFPK